MSTLYVTQQRAVVKKEGDCLLVQYPEDNQSGYRLCMLQSPNGQEEAVATAEIVQAPRTPHASIGKKVRVLRVPLIKVDQVVVFGNVTVTSPALCALLENHVEVCFLSYYGNFLGRLSPEFSKNSLIRLEQHRAHDDPVRAVALAKRFVWGKLSNFRTLLMRANRKLQNEDIEQAVAALKGIIDRVEKFGTGQIGSGAVDQKTSPLNPAVTAVNDLLGLEGPGSAYYFGVLGELLKQDWGFCGRHKRPPTDPVNTLLSYGYTLLMHKVASAIGVVGLDPYIGFLHSSQYGKPALALDLMEEFRGPVVDSVVITLLNTSALKHDDFVEEAGMFRMTEKGRRTFLEKFEERLNTFIEHPTFGYKATYQKCLELQVRLLAKNLTGEIPTYPPFIVR
jgi:CRISPR-associated protein Cas1